MKRNTIDNSCGKKGCQIYVLPYAATKENFQKYVDECIEDQTTPEKEIKEFIPSSSDLDWE